MRDQRDPAIIGAEITRLVKLGWPVYAAANTVCPPLPQASTDGQETGVPWRGYLRAPIDFRAAQEHAEGEA